MASEANIWWAYLSPGAAITKYQRCKPQALLHSSGSEKCEIKVSAQLVPFEGCEGKSPILCFSLSCCRLTRYLACRWHSHVSLHCLPSVHVCLCVWIYPFHYDTFLVWIEACPDDFILIWSSIKGLFWNKITFTGEWNWDSIIFGGVGDAGMQFDT